MTDFWIRTEHILDLVGATLPLASTDAVLPRISLVLLRRTGDYLTAVASDRYVLGMARRQLSTMDVEDAPPDGWRLAVAVADCKKLLTLARSYRKAKTQMIPFLFHEGVLRVGHDAELMICADLEERVGGVPATGGLLMKICTPDDGKLVTRAFGVDPAKVAQFKAAQRIFSAQPADPILLRHCKGVAFEVRIGDDFLGVLMGYRSPADGWPKLDFASWKGLA